MVVWSIVFGNEVESDEFGGQKKWMMCGNGGFGELCLYSLGMFD